MAFRRFFSKRPLKFLNLLLGSCDTILGLTDFWELLAEALDLSRDLDNLVRRLLDFKIPFSGASRELVLLPKRKILTKLLKAGMGVSNILEVKVGLLLLRDDDL